MVERANADFPEWNIGGRGLKVRLVEAVILFLGFCCLTLPVWSQATVTSIKEETWFSSRPLGAPRSERGAYRNPKMLLDFLQRAYPEVKIRRWARPAASREEGYREDIEAYQKHIRTWPSDRMGPIHLEAFRIRYDEVEHVRKLMSTLVPTALYQVDGKYLAVTGSANDLAQVRELLQEIDRPLDLVLLDYRLIDLSAEMQRTTGVTWAEPALKESRMEYVLGVPLSKAPTTDGPGIRLGSFARSSSSSISPGRPASVVPLVEGIVLLPRKRVRR